MDDKRRIAQVETRTQGDDPGPAQLIRYQFGNHLGSASLELDDQAQIISYEEYTPYGSTSYQAVRSQTETPKRYRYTGRERDEETGLSYHTARYYAPWLGRWISADPIGLQAGINLYLYVQANPAVMVDPTGMQECVPKEVQVCKTEAPSPWDEPAQQPDKPQTVWKPQTVQKTKGQWNLENEPLPQTVWKPQTVQKTKQQWNLQSEPLPQTVWKPQTVQKTEEQWNLEQFLVALARLDKSRLVIKAAAKPPEFNQPFSNKVVGEIVNHYVDKARVHKPENWTDQLGYALGLIIDERNVEPGRSKDLNYAAADHYLNTRAAISEVGPLGTPGSLLLTYGYDAVKSVTLPFEINANFLDTKSNMPSDPDSRVRAWVLQGMSDGEYDYQLGQGRPLSVSAEGHPTILAPPGKELSHRLRWLEGKWE